MFDLSITVSYILILLVLYLVSEITLYLIYKITQRKGFFRDKSISQYPIFSKNFLKIGVFGGSAAAGYNAEINFSTILQHELRHANNFRQKPLVMNFASSGMPFHDGQAKILKEFLPYFDLTIIYAGNNENLHYLTSTGALFIDKDTLQTNITINNQRNRKRMRLFTLERVVSNSNTANFLIRILRLLRLKIGNTVATSYQSDHTNIEEDILIDAVTTNPIITLDKKIQIEQLFLDDLTDISNQATLLGKKVLVVGMVNNDLFSPCQSHVSKTADKKEINAVLQNVKSRIAKSDYDTSLKILNQLSSKFGNISAINHLQALTQLKLNNLPEAVQHINNCFDNSTEIIGRSCYRLRTAINSLCSESESMDYLDINSDIHEFLKNPSEYSQLFRDVQHLSSLGHIVLGFRLLNYVCNNSKGFYDMSRTSLYDFQTLVDKEIEYFDQFEVSQSQIDDHNFLSFRWSLSCSLYSSNKEEYVAQARWYIDKWWQSVKSNVCRSEYLFWQGTAAYINGELDLAKQYLQDGVKINKKNIEHLLNKRGASGKLWKDRLSSIL